MLAVAVEVVEARDLVAVVVRVANEHATVSVQHFDVTVTVADTEGYLAAVGHNSHFQRAELVFNV